MSTQTNSLELSRRVVEWGLAKKAENVVVLDLTGIFDVTDYFVIMTAGSEIQLRAIADAIDDEARKVGQKPLHVEGREAGQWVLIDFVDVVVHVMLPEPRQKFMLERLWGDAPLTRFDEDGNVTQAPEDSTSGGATA